MNFDFLANINWADMVKAILMILGGASIIAKLTPSKLDDKIIGKLINIIGLAKKIAK